MAKIIFINQATGYLMKDVINAFCEKFDDVELIAGSVSEAGSRLNFKIKINKICSYKKQNIWYRLFSWVYATFQTIIIVNSRFRKSHLFITSNPPTLAFLPLFCKNRYSVLVYDVYPDGLIVGNFLTKDSLIFRLWKKQNFRYLKNALNIFTLTETMAETISQYIERESVKVIDPWSIFTCDSKISPEDNLFIKKECLQGYFIVMYSGNIGLGHNVEVLIDVARELLNEKEIKFVIIGDGWNKKLIEKKITEYKLNNCSLLPFQSHEMLKHSLSAADLSMVSVIKDGSRVCAPSKIYNLINLKIPILCVSEEETGLPQFVTSNGIGQAFGKSQISDIAKFIMELKNNILIHEKFKNNLKRCSMKFQSQNASQFLTDFIL